jgi:two-component system sensor histidine kinase KdpD
LALAVTVTGVSTLIGLPLARVVAITNLAMVYLLGVVIVAAYCRPSAAIIASVLSVAAFDFTFVPPQGTFAVSDVEYVFTFAAMLVVGVLISTLAMRLREVSGEWRAATLDAESERIRGDLLSSVSHDLRTPLAAIEGCASALQTEGLSEQGRSLAATIETEAHRMTRLVRNLLDMTRVAGAVHLLLDWHALDEIAASAISRTEALFETRPELKVGDDNPLLRCDGELVEQVLVNLLENAAHHASPSQVWVEIVRRDDGALLVSVEDDGPGVDESRREWIFGRFQRGAKGGPGLGLAICRAAVEAHGGTITATNRPGRGARFEVVLPATLQP